MAVLLLGVGSFLLSAAAAAKLALLLLARAQFHARAPGAPAPVVGAREPPPRREARRQAHLRVRALGSRARAVGSAVAGDERDPRGGQRGRVRRHGAAGACGSARSRLVRAAPRRCRSSPACSFAILVVGRAPTPASAREHLDEAVGRHVESV